MPSLSLTSSSFVFYWFFFLQYFYYFQFMWILWRSLSLLPFSSFNSIAILRQSHSILRFDSSEKKGGKFDFLFIWFSFFIKFYIFEEVYCISRKSLFEETFAGWVVVTFSFLELNKNEAFKVLLDFTIFKGSFLFPHLIRYN